MKRDKWRLRLKAAGLSQADIARLLGWQRSSVGRALDMDPPSKPVRAIIVAAEIMTGTQRGDWLQALRDTK